MLLQFALNVQRHSPQTFISLELVALQHLEWFQPLHELLVLALAAIYHKLSMKSLTLTAATSAGIASRTRSMI